MVISGMPATAMMSPGPALSAGLRSSASVISSSVIFTRLWGAVVAAPHDGLALGDGAVVDTRAGRAGRGSSTSRGSSRAPGAAPRRRRPARGWSRGSSRRGPRGRSPSGWVPFSGGVSEARPVLRRRVDDREVEQVGRVGGVVLEQVEEQLGGLVDDLGDPASPGRSTLLTQRMTGSRAVSALRRTNRVCGSGPSEASTSRTTPSTMLRPRSTSPPKSAWPGVSMMLIVTPSGRPASAADLPR